MKKLQDKPWLIIVFGFIFLIAIWIGFITLAVKNQPKVIPVPASQQGD